MRIYSDITKTIGNTPLVRLGKLAEGLRAQVLLKLEFFNPLGSVKDRIGLAMIEAAERSGKLKKGALIIEPTSGNTGIALAFVCAAKGYPLTLVMPETMSLERRALLLLLGANVVVTPGSLGMRGAIAKAIELRDKAPESFMPDQFCNLANPESHEETTAVEIWNDTDGQIDMFIAGIGTGGTLSGVAKYLKKKKHGIKIIGVEPSESAVVSGGKAGPHSIQGIGVGFIPKTLLPNLIDSIEVVHSDEAIEVARRLIKEEGIPVGVSAGASVCAALRLGALVENSGKVIVVIVPSYTERYLSTELAVKERELASQLPVTEVNPKYLSALSDKQDHSI